MEWLEEVGDVARLGVPIFLLLYLIVKMLPLPSWPLTIAVGAWFGFATGVALAVAVSFAGSVGAFLVSRYLLKHPVQKMVKRHPKLKAVDAAMREGGWKAVWLFQISPAVPFGIQNYFLGASKVDTRSYLIGTAISGIPAAILYVGIGAGARFVTSLDNEWKWWAVAAGIAATIGLTVWMQRLAKRRLKLA